jgi:lipopolysaccharide biosynthesis regulator YciM
MQQRFGIEPTSATYHETLRAYFLCDRIQEAISIFENMPQEKKDATVYSLMIMECCAAQQFENAKIYFNESVENKQIVDGRTFNILASKIIEKDGIQEAQNLMNTFEANSGEVTANLLQTMIDAYKDKSPEQVAALTTRLNQV